MFKKLTFGICLVAIISSGTLLFNQYQASLKEISPPIEVIKNENVTSNAIGKITNKFSNIYKTVYFHAQTRWPRKGIKDKLSIEYNRILGLHPFIKGILVLNSNGTYYTSNSLNSDGETIDTTRLEATNFNNVNWYKLYKDSSQINDISKNLVGLKVSSIYNSHSPIFNKKMSWQLFAKQINIRNSKGFPLAYDIFFFVETNWIHEILSEVRRNTSHFTGDDKLTFHAYSRRIANGTQIKGNKVINGLNWFINYDKAPLVVEKERQDHLGIILSAISIVSIVLVTFLLLTFKQGKSVASFPKRTKKKLLKDIERVNKKHTELAKSFSNLSEKLVQVKSQLKLTPIHESSLPVVDISKLEEASTIISELKESSQNENLEINHFPNEIISELKQLKADSLNLGLLSEFDLDESKSFISKKILKTSNQIINKLNRDELITAEHSEIFSKQLNSNLTKLEKAYASLVKNNAKSSSNNQDNLAKIMKSIEESLDLINKKEEQLTSSNKAINEVAKDINSLDHYS